MAVAAQKSVASLMRKTLDRQAATARENLKLKERQVEKIISLYLEDRTCVPYRDLIKVLSSYPLNDENYKVLLDDCVSSVVLLGRDMKQFVEVMCDLDWTSRSDELVELYGRFMLNLVTAHTYHCPLVLTKLVSKFKADGDNWDEKPPLEVLHTWSNIHTIIAQIVATMPMTRDLLMQKVIHQFPYYKAGVHQNRAYIHNLIWMTKYIPSLREHIMSAIIIRMVEMDSNVVDKEKNQRQAELMFEMETDEKDELALTLDYSMLEMLRWMEEERDPVLFSICGVFERVVLPTHGIKHVQFLLLYAISINQQCADRVLSNLWLVCMGAHGLGAGLATRRTAASHLAGLLARCVRVPNTRLIHYLRTMCEWCHSYITATQESTTSDVTKVHGAFHAICHAIFYLVAFKHHHLFASKENVNFVESLNLPRLVTCSLNPLRTCPPQVARAFSAVTRSHQVVYCQAIMERNTRSTLHSDTDALEYDDWFPYDPYTLPVSGKIIWPLCIEYKDWGRDTADVTQYSGMKRKLEEEDDFLTSPSMKLASSLSNCASPGFRTSESVM